MEVHVFEARLEGRLEAVRPRVEAVFRDAGFGVLTEIDVRRTLAEKLGEEIEPYLILGVCNPALAHRALSHDRSIGALLPCGVALRQVGDAVAIYVQNPMAMLAGMAPEARARLAGVTEEAAARLKGALERLAAAT